MSNILPPDIILLWCPVGGAQNTAYPPGIVDQSTGYSILEPYSNPGVHFTGEVGVVIQLNTGIDLTTASSVSINVSQPNGSTATWAGTVVALDGVNSVLQYLTQSGDFYYPGTYTVQPVVSFSNWSGVGEEATFTIYEPIVSTAVPPSPIITASASFTSSFVSTPWTQEFGSFNFVAGKTSSTPGLAITSVQSLSYPGNIAVMSYTGSGGNVLQSSSVVMAQVCIDEDYDSVGPAVNVQANGAFYGFYVTHTTGTAYLFYQYGSAQTVLSSMSGVVVNVGDTVTLTSNGGVLVGYINSIPIISTVSTLLTSGTVGIQGFAFYSGGTDYPDTRISSWTGSW